MTCLRSCSRSFVLLTFLLYSPTVAQTRPAGASAEDLSRLLVDLLTIDGLWARNQVPQIWVERLPPAFSEPLPPELAVRGAVSQLRDYYDLILVSSRPREEVADLISDFYLGLGWTALSLDPLSRFQPRKPAVFCPPGGGLSLTFALRERGSGQTDVKVRRYQRTDCEEEREELIIPAEHLLPLLENPRGSRVIESGGNGGGLSARSQIVVDTAFSLERLLLHYSKQLASAGWERLESDSSGFVCYFRRGARSRRRRQEPGWRIEAYGFPAPSQSRASSDGSSDVEKSRGVGPGTGGRFGIAGPRALLGED